MREDVAQAVGTLILGVLVTGVSAGVLAVTLAFPISGYAIVAKGGFLFGPFMIFIGLLGLGKVLFTRATKPTVLKKGRDQATLHRDLGSTSADAAACVGPTPGGAGEVS